ASSVLPAVWRGGLPMTRRPFALAFLWALSVGIPDARLAFAQADCEDIDLAHCKDRGGRRCVDPIAPPLTDACAGQTTPIAGADCVCDVADGLAQRML